MIQRKQTVYLLVALLALIVCLCLPIGSIEPKGMGTGFVWYNAGLTNGQQFVVRPILFVDLVVAGTLALTSIFLYRRRLFQARMCTVGIILCLAWYVYYGICVLGELLPTGNFRLHFAAGLPLVAIILFVMAHRGIMADEKLVRSMDRIR